MKTEANKSKGSKINKEWHATHIMPKNATIEQRIEWHLAHKDNCKCRDIPEKLKEEMTRRHIPF